MRFFGSREQPEATRAVSRNITPQSNLPGADKAGALACARWTSFLLLAWLFGSFDRCFIAALPEETLNRSSCPGGPRCNFLGRPAQSPSPRLASTARKMHVVNFGTSRVGNSCCGTKASLKRFLRAMWHIAALPPQPAGARGCVNSPHCCAGLITRNFILPVT